ncbi:MAG: hypothetical protein NTX25_01335, partial [Proteobacteria bacterium]|nr:hypothetical protein [Pseudomonadota bacterium]
MASKDTIQLEQLKQWNDITQAKGFLAADFLLWLWYYSESEHNPGRFFLPSDPQEYLVKIWIEDRLVLESNTAKAQVHLLKGGEPSRSLEAEAALQTGKGVNELKLGLHIDPFGDFFCLMSAKDLAPRTITLPAPAIAGESSHQRPSLAYRLKMTEILVQTLDVLFKK